MIINEVFTLSPDKYYAYSWFELYNPTPRPIPWYQKTYPIQSYAVGDGGVVVHSNDDGTTWSSSPSGTALDLNAIVLPYTDTGIVVGDAGLMEKMLIDTNGVPTFVPMVSGTAQNINTICWAPLSRIGFFAADHGVIMRTINGGATWTNQPVSPATTRNFRSIFFVNFFEYAVGDSGLVAKRSTGITFQQQSVPVNFQQTNFHAIFF